MKFFFWDNGTFQSQRCLGICELAAADLSAWGLAFLSLPCCSRPWSTRGPLPCLQIETKLQTEGAEAAYVLVSDADKEPAVQHITSKLQFKLLAGKVCQMAGHLSKSEKFLRSAMQYTPNSCDVGTYHMLAGLYVSGAENGTRAHFEALETARDVYEAACQKFPCATSWLRCGQHHAR